MVIVHLQFARSVTAEHHQRRDSKFKLGGDDLEEDEKEEVDEEREEAENRQSQTTSTQLHSDHHSEDNEDSDEAEGPPIEQVDSGVECASPASSKSNPTLSDVEEVKDHANRSTHGQVALPPPLNLAHLFDQASFLSSRLPIWNPCAST